MVLESRTRDGHHARPVPSGRPFNTIVLETEIDFETYPNYQKQTKIAISTTAVGVQFQSDITMETAHKPQGKSV